MLFRTKIQTSLNYFIAFIFCTLASEWRKSWSEQSNNTLRRDEWEWGHHGQRHWYREPEWGCKKVKKSVQIINCICYLHKIRWIFDGFCRHLVQFEVNIDKAGGNNLNRTESNGRLETARKKKTKSLKMDPVTTECSVSEVVPDNRFLETSL